MNLALLADIDKVQNPFNGAVILCLLFMWVKIIRLETELKEVKRSTAESKPH